MCIANQSKSAKSDACLPACIAVNKFLFHLLANEPIGNYNRYAMLLLLPSVCVCISLCVMCAALSHLECDALSSHVDRK